MDFARLLFSFEGRIDGRTYATLSIFLFALILLFRAAGMAGGADAARLGLLLSLPLTWCYFAAAVKRNHDRGKSGWWSLLLLIPVVNFFVWLLDLCLGETRPGPNRYAPAPRASGEAEAAEIFS